MGFFEHSMVARVNQMFAKKRWWFLITLLFLLLGSYLVFHSYCVHLRIEDLQTNPIAAPEFVFSIHPPEDEDVPSSQRIYVWILQRPLWRPEDNALDLELHIMSSTYFAVNGWPRRPDNVSTLKLFGRTETGQITDKYNGPLEFCISPYLPKGRNLLTVTTSGTTGEQISYSWVVIVL